MASLQDHSEMKTQLDLFSKGYFNLPKCKHHLACDLA